MGSLGIRTQKKYAVACRTFITCLIKHPREFLIPTFFPTRQNACNARELFFLFVLIPFLSFMTFYLLQKKPSFLDFFFTSTSHTDKEICYVFMMLTLKPEPECEQEKSYTCYRKLFLCLSSCLIK